MAILRPSGLLEVRDDPSSARASHIGAIEYEFAAPVWVAGKGWRERPEAPAVRRACAEVGRLFDELDGPDDGPGPDPTEAYERLRLEARAATQRARAEAGAPWLRKLAGLLLSTTRAVGAALLWPRAGGGGADRKRHRALSVAAISAGTP